MTEESLYSFSCPVCQAELSLPLSQAGISGPCPFCRQTITAPIPKAGTVPVPPRQTNPRGGKRAKPAPVRMDSAPVPQAQARTSAAAERGAVVTKDEPEEDPGARRASRLMGLIGALAAIGAGAAGVFAWQKLGSKEPASGSPSVAGPGTPDAAPAQPDQEPAPAKTAPEGAPQTPPAADTAAISPAPQPVHGDTIPDKNLAGDAGAPATTAEAPLKDPTAADAPDSTAPAPAMASAETPGTNPDTQPAPAAPPGPDAPSPADGAGNPATAPGTPAKAAPPEVAVTDSGTANPAATPATPAVEEKPYERQVPPPNPEDPAIILREPRDALLAFLNAKDWQTRLKFSLRPEDIRTEMEAYYKENKDGPVDAKIDYLASDFTEDTRTPMWFFNVLTPDSAPIPVALEKTKSGIRVDWRGFIEGYDRRLAKFCARPVPGQGTFYVAASRAHWFGGKVEGIDSMACFKLYPPTVEEHFLALVDTGSPLWEEKFVATGRAAWEVQSRMIVTIEWAKSGDTDYLRLVDIKADSWRADARASAPEKGQ